MLLDDLAKELLGDATSTLNQFDIPAEKAADAMNIANTTVVDEFKNRAGNNNLNELLDLFNGNQDINSSGLVSNLSGGLASQLGSKLNISPQMAMAAASAILPMLLSKLNDATPSSGLSEDNLSDILGGAGGFGGIAGKLKDLLT